MKITSSRKKFRDIAEREYGGKVSLGAGLVVRDHKLMAVSKRHKLIDKTASHLKAAELFAKHLQKVVTKNFIVVPIKSHTFNRVDGSATAAQRYFERPTLFALLNYYNFIGDMGEIERKVVSKARAIKEVHFGRHGMNDLTFAKKLLRENPRITKMLCYATGSELINHFNEARDSIPEMRNFVFSLSNYLVFGVDKKTGKLKIGVVDL